MSNYCLFIMARNIYMRYNPIQKFKKNYAVKGYWSVYNENICDRFCSIEILLKPYTCNINRRVINVINSLNTVL